MIVLSSRRRKHQAAFGASGVNGGGVYLLTTRLPVATKMILQILSDSGILRVAWNTVDPYTLPASHHIFFRSNGIIKCGRNIKYSRAALGFKF